MRGKTKHMKLPNGFGRITKLNKKNLRNPYRVMITTGKDTTGKPVGKLLKPQAYFKTYNEAYEALMKYHEDPYSLNSTLTVEELYEKWSGSYFETLKSKSSSRTITSAWMYCSPLYKYPVNAIRARHIKGLIDEAQMTDEKGNIKQASSGTKARIKSLFNLMLDYAVEYEIVDRNYARTFELNKEITKDKDQVKRPHMAFKDSELDILWGNLNVVPYVDVVLVQCYSGWRPQELGLIRLEDVNLNTMTFKGGMKTTAGIDRVVPIHSCIQPIVRNMYVKAESLGSEYLINCTDTCTHRSSLMFTYDKYKGRFQKIVDQLHLNPDHRPHDGRKQFVTMAKKANVDEYAIKRIIGHQISDITESVYTERDIDWLRKELEKIPPRNFS